MRRDTSPCNESWDRMEGDDRWRRCEACRLLVYDLSGMTRAEAEALVRGREGRLCVRFYRRADGTVLTRDCPVGLSTARWRMLRTVAGGLALSSSVLAAAYFGVETPQDAQDAEELRTRLRDTLRDGILDAEEHLRAPAEPK